MLLHIENILHQHYIYFHIFIIFTWGYNIKIFFEHTIKVVAKGNERKFVLNDLTLRYILTICCNLVNPIFKMKITNL